ncbi:hypothetical protein VN97_g1546 [Penicillium thymicola]|uniref:Uncharacterized protein n=1 Tax=Penicillium thymicola TaxID=293382 RepID=A0AAI9XC79_PENTH|nr:hypothetical protein VN97_g1546 [Penicillium thymicola]
MDEIVGDYEKSLNGQTQKQAFARVHIHFSTCEYSRKLIEDQRFVSHSIGEMRKNIDSPRSDKSERDSHFMMVVGWQLVRNGGFSITFSRISRLLGLLLHAMSNSARVQAEGPRDEAEGTLKPINSSP